MRKLSERIVVAVLLMCFPGFLHAGGFVAEIPARIATAFGYVAPTRILDFSGATTVEIIHGAHFTGFMGPTNRLSVHVDGKHVMTEIGTVEVTSFLGIRRKSDTRPLVNKTREAVESALGKAGLTRISSDNRPANADRLDVYRHVDASKVKFD